MGACLAQPIISQHDVHTACMTRPFPYADDVFTMGRAAHLEQLLRQQYDSILLYENGTPLTIVSSALPYSLSSRITSGGV